MEAQDGSAADKLGDSAYVQSVVNVAFFRSGEMGAPVQLLSHKEASEGLDYVWQSLGLLQDWQPSFDCESQGDNGKVSIEDTKARVDEMIDAFRKKALD